MMKKYTENETLNTSLNKLAESIRASGKMPALLRGCWQDSDDDFNSALSAMLSHVFRDSASSDTARQTFRQAVKWVNDNRQLERGNQAFKLTVKFPRDWKKQPAVSVVTAAMGEEKKPEADASTPEQKPEAVTADSIENQIRELLNQVETLESVDDQLKVYRSLSRSLESRKKAANQRKRQQTA